MQEMLSLFYEIFIIAFIHSGFFPGYSRAFAVSLKENILLIPKEFSKTLNGDNVVYILEDDKPAAKKIKIGLETISQVEILEGLDEGQEIILVNNGKK